VKPGWSNSKLTLRTLLLARICRRLGIAGLLDVGFEVVDGQAIGATKDMKVARETDFVVTTHALACNQFLISLATPYGLVQCRPSRGASIQHGDQVFIERDTSQNRGTLLLSKNPR
jgi:hypothetical protein